MIEESEEHKIKREEHWKRMTSKVITFEDRMVLFRIFWAGFHDDLMYRNFEFKGNQENFEKIFDDIGIPRKLNRRMNLIGGTEEYTGIPKLRERVEEFVYTCFDEVYDFKNKVTVKDFLSGSGTTFSDQDTHD
jgi:hypothetical protein